MIPRTKNQKIVASLFQRLPPISDRDFGKISKEMNSEAKVFNARGKKYYCDVCGGEMQGGTFPSVCPHCSRKIAGEYGRDYYGRIIASCTYHSYITVMTTCEGWQVIRTFFAKNRCRRGKRSCIELNEVHQWWINSKGEYVLVSSAGCSNLYNDAWCLGSDLEVRSMNDLGVCRGYYASDHRLKFGKILSCRLTPEVKRNGVTRQMLDKVENPLAVISNVLKNHDYEALLKSKQVELANHITERMDLNTSIPPYSAVRLCDRHGYIITDVGLWLDHVRLLRELGKDMHSPHYVCPKDLIAQHAVLVKEKRAIDERKRQEEQRREAYKQDEIYRKSHARFLGIRFGNDNLSFHVLQSASEVYEEGKAMHHCVYSCGYYKKENTLLLSCRDALGKRIETVEINTKRYSIEQSRGVNNSQTQHHEEILALVNANMHLIRIANEGGVQQNLNFAA